MQWVKEWEELKVTSQPVPREMECIKDIDEEGEVVRCELASTACAQGKLGTDWLGAQRSGFGLQSLAAPSLETLDL